jgi:hypothetical protein
MINISYSKLGQLGRLGNQLFQIAATIGLAIKNNATCTFPAWIYEKYFENPLPRAGKIEAYSVLEPFFHYCDFKIMQSCNLGGYLQSEKYWQHCIPQVMEQFKFKKTYKDGIAKKYAHILKKETIALSIRRGDFVGNPNYAQLPVNYYITALEKHFPEWRKKHVLVFSDDIAYCKLHFQNYENFYYTESSRAHLDKSRYFSENGYAIEQLCLGSMCQHFILSNSTFSWWLAYLGETSKSKVIRPINTLAGNLKKNNDTKDYYPTRWQQHEEQKIDLLDVTFMIPVSYDHLDRKHNLSLNVCMLQRHFDTNIIIMEQGTQMFDSYQNYGCEYVRVKYKDFHRTRMLNDMARMARTSIIVNWDADVFISPAQILHTVELIRTGAADMVFPYDGKFARVPRTYFKTLEQHFDVGMFTGLVFKGMNHEDKDSVGGAIFFNRSKYFAGGGENENFIAYGPEDVERDARFRRLGYNVQRVNGALYHIDHFKGPNSKCSANPYDKQNHDELEKIYSFTPEALRAYVNTWPITKEYNGAR